MNIQEQARVLHAQGFRLMPLRGKGRTILNGFAANNPSFNCGPEWFGDPDTLIGLLCGPCPALGEDCLLCVDLDGDFENDHTITAFLNLLPHTLCSHEGRHLFFRVPPSPERDRLAQWRDALGTKTASGAALDLRWAGGYACERGDWGPTVALGSAAESVAVLPPAALLALLAANGGGRERDRDQEWETERRVDPDCVPDVATWDALLEGWASMYPPEGAGGGRDICFALGGLMARGCWTDELCQLFLEELLARTTPDPKHQQDGLTCALLSLEKGPDAPGVYGFPKLVQLLSPHVPVSAGGPPAATRVTMFLESFVTLMQPEPKTLLQLDAVSTIRTPDDDPSEPGEDPDQLLADLNLKLMLKKGEFCTHSENVFHVLDLHPVWRKLFAWNELSKRVVIRRNGPDGIPLRAGEVFSVDDDTIHVQRWLTRLFLGREPARETVTAAIRAVAMQHAFHPVRQYLRALPPWDGVDRNFTLYLGADPTPYQRAACAAWIRSAVARAFEPGCQADEVLILEGNQGARKGSVLRALCANEDWFFNVRGDLRSKDFVSAMRGKWIGEIAEIDRLISSRDASELKDLITTRVDTFRPAFGREDRDFRRECVLAGSTNLQDYLRDPTGNRRYRPVGCGAAIDDRALVRDRDQFWAQAVFEYDTFVSRGRDPRDPLAWWLNNDAAEVAKVETAARLEHDDWEDLITERLDSLLTPATEQIGFTTAQALGVLPGAVPGAQIGQADSRRMAKVLRKLGFEYLPTRTADSASGKRWRQRAGQ